MSSIIQIKYSTGKPASAIFSFTSKSSQSSDVKINYKLASEEYGTRVFGNILQMIKSGHTTDSELASLKSVVKDSKRSFKDNYLSFDKLDFDLSKHNDFNIDLFRNISGVGKAIDSLSVSESDHVAFHIDLCKSAERYIIHHVGKFNEGTSSYKRDGGLDTHNSFKFGKNSSRGVSLIDLFKYSQDVAPDMYIHNTYQLLGRGNDVESYIDKVLSVYNDTSDSYINSLDESLGKRQIGANSDSFIKYFNMESKYINILGGNENLGHQEAKTHYMDNKALGYNSKGSNTTDIIPGAYIDSEDFSKIYSEMLVFKHGSTLDKIDEFKIIDYEENLGTIGDFKLLEPMGKYSIVGDIISSSIKYQSTADCYEDYRFLNKINLNPAMNESISAEVISRDRVGITDIKSFDSSSAYIDRFDYEKSLASGNSNLYLIYTSTSLREGGKNIRVGSSIKHLGSYSKYLDIVSSGLFMDGNNSELGMYEVYKSLGYSGKSIDKVDTTKWLEKDGSGISIYNNYASFSKSEIDLRHSEEYFKLLDSSEKSVGISDNKFISGGFGDLDIENTCIFGYNEYKDTDKDKLTPINIIKGEKNFNTLEYLWLSDSGEEAFMDDNETVYVEDFVPPIEVLKGAIDELLLPRSEYDYTNYRDEVFGENLSINPKYLKGISDEGNPIVAVPIDNPIKYYTDIAKDYLDVDVSIMRRVLELLYKNWRENIQRFAGLKADKAMNYILERTHDELKTWYTSVTDKTRIAHAERSLKLFAWYSEMGILTHSDKEVIYDRANGVLGFWDELPQYNAKGNTKVKGIDVSEFIKLDFSYSNSKPYILSSTPGVSAKMHLKSMPQNKETILKLKAYIIGSGEVTVTVGQDKYKYTSRVNDISIVLPKEDNSFVVEFKPGTLDSFVDIGNFIIEDRYNEGYKLDYNGTVSNVNFTIQYILDFMTIAGDSIEEVQPVLKTTAQLAYALDKFREYMGTHHDNMHKGKRLTIRK